MNKEINNDWFNEVIPDYKGVYHHNKTATYLRVLGNTKTHIIVKWGDREVVRSLDYLKDFSKIQNTKENRLLH